MKTFIRTYINNFILIVICAFMFSCSQKNNKTIETPWGTTLNDTATTSNSFDFDNIMFNGEIIVLTTSSPQTYYDYNGKNMGFQYLLFEKFAKHVGLSVRIELCKDSVEIIQKLKKGEGDIIIQPISTQYAKQNGITLCGYKDKNNSQWAVLTENSQLASEINKWYNPKFIAEIQQEETTILTKRLITHRVYSAYLNKSKGVISQYDHFFKQYAPIAGFDWRLIAAQCYQESAFDSNAKSWAGACGLMQIMPRTAAHLGLSENNIFLPEHNIAAGAKYLSELNNLFKDVKDSKERIKFVLAGYNGGHYHIRDAMALAQKYGENKYSWNSVSKYVLLLSTPQYYNDKVVKYGYMRGSETVNYVQLIANRYYSYGGNIESMSTSSNLLYNGTPKRAKHKNRFK